MHAISVYVTRRGNICTNRRWVKLKHELGLGTVENLEVRSGCVYSKKVDVIFNYERVGVTNI